ncbi:MAG TPA: sugar ABC transporter ATP-binding protein [Pseudonocardiaceae bacterium]|nr:sugar ABC transporter ATP-binding protein [Pseudonocardiaceae bacterium]
MHGITKRYGGVQACRDIDLTLAPGEVHALLGENGAGKSTLMKILSGDITDYEGRIEITGQPRRFSGPADAQTAGIAIIHQELDLVPALSVADNVFLGRELRRHGRLDRAAMAARTRELLKRIGVRLEPGRLVEELRTGEQQLVVIAKALSLHARVLIMDEPTSALSSSEVDRLFEVTRELRRDGVGIIYISHRMDEISRIADRATVLRNGRVAATFDPRTMSTSQVVEAMVGRPVHQVFSTPDTTVGEELLWVENLAMRPRHVPPGRQDPNGISLTVHAGEIVGLAGLLGSGRTELLETLYGVGSAGPRTGRILLGGAPIAPRSARQALHEGLAFVPEDRRVGGLVLFHSVLANLVIASLGTVGRLGFVLARRERHAAQQTAVRLGIKTAAITEAVGNLSGGNQQKVVLGRVLRTQPRVLLLDEPTRGVDVGAKAEIYELLGELARQGLGVLLASSELPELTGVCDRVVVLRHGQSVAEFDTATAGEAELLAAAMGAKPAPAGSTPVGSTPVGGTRQPGEVP